VSEIEKLLFDEVPIPKGITLQKSYTLQSISYILESWLD
jgi:hypothetical protein